MRQQQDKAQIILLLGARSVEQLNDNLQVLDFELSQEELGEIDQIANFRAGFLWDFLHDDSVLELIH